MDNMLTVSTAECFTHGKVGREIHSIAQGYLGEFGREFIDDLSQYGSFDYNNISLICSLFIPTISAVKSVLKVKNPPEPLTLIKGIKVYNEEEDKKVAEIMAKAIKEITNSDIAIGSTAGIGHGGLAIVTDELTIITTSDVYADLRENNSEDLLKRQKSGILKTIEIFLLLINNNLETIESMENTKIIKNKP